MSVSVKNLEVRADAVSHADLAHPFAVPGYAHLAHVSGVIDPADDGSVILRTYRAQLHSGEATGDVALCRQPFNVDGLALDHSRSPEILLVDQQSLAGKRAAMRIQSISLPIANRHGEIVEAVGARDVKFSKSIVVSHPHNRLFLDRRTTQAHLFRALSESGCADNTPDSFQAFS